MIVLDPSALTEVIVGGRRAPLVGPVLAADGDWWAPEHFLVEAISALRGLWLGGHLDDGAFAAAAERALSVGVSTVRTTSLVGRMLQLASRATAYDAAYIALAETLDCPLVTLDRRLRALQDVRCRFLPDLTR